MGDAEYLSAFLQIVMPIAREFNPQLVIVAAGFDAGAGDPLGGCHVSPACYGQLTKQLSSLALGRLAILLEGGYSLKCNSQSMSMCARALLGYSLPPLHPLTAVRPSAVDAIRASKVAHLPYWSSLASAAPIDPILRTLQQLNIDPKVVVEKITDERLLGMARTGLLNPLDKPDVKLPSEPSVRARSVSPFNFGYFFLLRP